MKKFRIIDRGSDYRYGRYRVDQKHHILFIPYWDIGAEMLCPKYFFDTEEEALMAIARAITKTTES